MSQFRHLFALLFLALALVAPPLDAANFLYPVTQPFKLYTDTNGGPLNNGFLYFGQPNQNPETTPIQMYWDAAGAIPAAQPIRTVNGYISRNGVSPANIFATGDFAITVKNARGALVFTNPTSTDLQLALAITSIGTAAAIPLVDAGNFFITKNVEAAFQQIAGPAWVTRTNLNSDVQQSLLPTGTVLDYCGSGTGTPPGGFVFGSGQTIGDGSSGATAAGGAGTQASALYTLLWNNYDNTRLPIQDSAGTPTTRGASASNDFAAHKRLPVPDYRDRVRAGLATLGGTTDAGRLTAGGSGIDGTVMGNAGGAETHMLTTAESPAHSHTITEPNGGTGHTHTQNAHSHTITEPNGGTGHQHTYDKPNVSGNTTAVAGAGLNLMLATTSTISTLFAVTGIVINSATATNQNATTGITINSSGGGGAHTVTQPTIINTVIIKL